MRRLRPSDVSDRRHDHAPHPPAATDIVPGRPPRGDPIPTVSPPCSFRPSSASAPPGRPGYPDRDLLEGMVEIGESSITSRTKDDPVAGRHRPQSRRKNPRRRGGGVCRGRQGRTHQAEADRGLHGGDAERLRGCEHSRGNDCVHRWPYHGFRRAHIQAYLVEFVFQWNRRRYFRSSFDMLLGIGLRTAPIDYWALIGRSSPNRN